MENKWVVGDMHLGHSKIIDYCNRPFSSIEEMDETIIDNYNKVIKKNDLVYILGDFALCGKDDLINYGKRLKGRKVLIWGNHENSSLKNYYEAGFQWISKSPIIIENQIILSHQPQNIEDCGIYKNIFAHVHNSLEYKTVTENTACVSMERWDYIPVEISKLIELMKLA